MFTAVFTTLLMGCTQNFVTAPYDARVVVPSDFVFGWNDQLNQYDLAGIPLIVNIGVTDAQGFPLEHIALEVSSGCGGVYILPEEAVELVGYPGVPDNIQSIDDVRAACVDENGNYALVEDWCSWFWDAEGSQFYMFSGTYADNFSYSDSGGLYFFAPTYASVQTNNQGLARMVVFVDSVPLDGSSYASCQMTASTGFSSDSFNVTFTGESAAASAED